jgi:hypothetical protein
MSQTPRQAIEALQRDIARWRDEVAFLEREGHFELAKLIKVWIQEGERIIASSGKPHAQKTRAERQFVGPRVPSEFRTQDGGTRQVRGTSLLGWASARSGWRSLMELRFADFGR